MGTQAWWYLIMKQRVHHVISVWEAIWKELALCWDFPLWLNSPERHFSCYLYSFWNFSPNAKIVFPFTCPGMTKAQQKWFPAQYRTGTLLLSICSEFGRIRRKHLVLLLSKIWKWRSTCLWLSEGYVGITVSLFPLVMRINFTGSFVNQNRLELPLGRWWLYTLRFCIIPHRDINCCCWDGQGIVGKYKLTLIMGAKEQQIAWKPTLS